MPAPVSARSCMSPWWCCWMISGLIRTTSSIFPIRAAAKAAAAVAGGHVDMIFQNLSGLVSNIEAGNIWCPLPSPRKSGWLALPDVPTVAELGHPELETIIGWSGIWGPKNLPQEVVEKWVDVLQELKIGRDLERNDRQLWGPCPGCSAPMTPRPLSGSSTRSSTRSLNVST